MGSTPRVNQLSSRKWSGFQEQRESSVLSFCRLSLFERDYFCTYTVPLPFQKSPPLAEPKMLTSQFFLLAEGQLARRLEIECAGDQQAITEARRFAKDHTAVFRI